MGLKLKRTCSSLTGVGFSEFSCTETYCGSLRLSLANCVTCIQYLINHSVIWDKNKLRGCCKYLLWDRIKRTSLCAKALVQQIKWNRKILYFTYSNGPSRVRVRVGVSCRFWQAPSVQVEMLCMQIAALKGLHVQSHQYKLLFGSSFEFPS